MVFYNCRNETFVKLRRVKELMDEMICKKRDMLNKSIEDGEDYDTILRLSVELDELIAEYYRIYKDGKVRNK